MTGTGLVARAAQFVLGALVTTVVRERLDGLRERRQATHDLVAVFDAD